MEIKLYKKEGTYFSEKDKKDKPFTNFYIQCSDVLIPVEIKYFPNANFQNRDPGYQGRFAVLSAFAEPLPEVPKKEEKTELQNAPQNSASASQTEAPTSDGRAF